MRVMQVSERFACRVTGQHRTTQRHRRASETLADRDAALRAWLRQWAKQHPAGGFRRAYHAARAEGRDPNLVEAEERAARLAAIQRAERARAETRLLLLGVAFILGFSVVAGRMENPGG